MTESPPDDILDGALVWVEGSETAFRCGSRDTILRSALRGGIGFPYECNSGGCGTCAYELVSGEIEELWPTAPGLGERARARGRRLGCQTRAVSDCRIKVRLSEEYAPRILPRQREVTLTRVRALTADMSEFTFLANEPAEFLAGQFALLQLPLVSGQRAYSMSNLPNASGEWRFIVKRAPAGSGSDILFRKLAIGGRLTLDGPYGMSFLRTESRRNIICIAGGSGLSPVMSIMRAVAADARFSGQTITLFYGGRSPSDICVHEELGADLLLRDRVTLHASVSDPDAPGIDTWAGARGFIHELVRETLGTEMAQFEFYFCGPPPMTDALHRLLLLDAKVPPEQLHFDRFL